MVLGERSSGGGYTDDELDMVKDVADVVGNGYLRCCIHSPCCTRGMTKRGAV